MAEPGETRLTAAIPGEFLAFHFGNCCSRKPLGYVLQGLFYWMGWVCGLLARIILK